MVKIYNAPFSSNFLEEVAKKIISIIKYSGKQNGHLIFIPNKRIQNVLMKILCSLGVKVSMPKSITFSCMYEDLLELNKFNNKNSFSKAFYKQMIPEDQLYFIISSIIEGMKKSKKYDKKILCSIKCDYVIQTIDEYYYYEYYKQKLKSSSSIEKIILGIIEEIELFLKKNNCKTRAQMLGLSAKEIIKNWALNYDKEEIFVIFPKTEAEYVKYFMDEAINFENLHIFSRGYNKKWDQQLICQKSFDQFLKRNNIHSNNIENIVEEKQDVCRSQTDLFHPNNEIEFKNISIIKAKDQNQEARLIALIIKEILELSNKKIIVQTKSIKLAKLIQVNLKFWRINSNNLLAENFISQFDQFFILIILYLKSEKQDYSLFLDILKSRFCMIIDKETLKVFEVEFLRKTLFKEKIQDNFTKEDEEIFHAIVKVDAKFRNVKKIIKNKDLTFEEIFALHMDLLEFLTSNFFKEKKCKLYTNIRSKIKIINEIKSFNIVDYLKILKHLLTVKPEKINPQKLGNVTIMDTIENRDIQYEILIFASLNETSLLSTPFKGSYFSNQFRTINNLQNVDAEVSFAQYDFTSALYNQRVILSYAEHTNYPNDRVYRGLDKLLSIKNIQEKSQNYTNKYLNIIMNIMLTSRASKSISPQYYPVPIQQRPAKISVSGIENLMSNPYVYYVKYILSIFPLQRIAKIAEKKEFGILIHRIIAYLLPQNFVKKSNFIEAFMDRFLIETKMLSIPSKINFFWRKRAYNIARCVFNHFIQNDQGLVSYSEIPGSLDLVLNNKNINIYCIADRINLISKDLAKITDFKSGLMPSNSQITKGLNPQLTIEEYIFIKDGFDLVKNNRYKLILEYFDVSGKSEHPNFLTIQSNPRHTEEGVKKLLETFLCSEVEFFINYDQSSNRKNKEFFHVMRYEP